MKLLKARLIEICHEVGEDGAPMGVVFKTGQMVSGAVRIAKTVGDDVLFEMASMGEVGDASGRRQPAAFHFFFEIDAVERFMLAEAVEAPRIASAGPGGIIIPRS